MFETNEIDWLSYSFNFSRNYFNISNNMWKKERNETEKKMKQSREIEWSLEIFFVFM